MNANKCKYNYVFYGATNDFVRLAMEEYNYFENSILMEDPAVLDNSLIKNLYKLHTYPYANKHFEIPLKNVWNKFYTIPKKFDERPICFVFFAKYTTNKQLHRYLREKYPGCKLVVQFWDLVKKNLNWFPNMNIKYVKDEFDLVLSFDKNDCENYGFEYFCGETANKQNISMSSDVYESDLVYIGRGKDRNEALMRIYDIVTDAGFSCFFYIVEEGRIHHSHKDICFTRKLMPYRDVLQHVVDSRCILELVQDGQYGFSSRAKEAFIYNKKLITDSKIVKDTRFYPSKDICFIDNTDDIDLSILRDYSDVNFNYDGDYSAEKVIELIESLL